MWLETKCTTKYSEWSRCGCAIFSTRSLPHCSTIEWIIRFSLKIPIKKNYFSILYFKVRNNTKDSSECACEAACSMNGNERNGAFARRQKFSAFYFVDAKYSVSSNLDGPKIKFIHRWSSPSAQHRTVYRISLFLHRSSNGRNRETGRSQHVGDCAMKCTLKAI